MSGRTLPEIRRGRGRPGLPAYRPQPAVAGVPRQLWRGHAPVPCPNHPGNVPIGLSASPPPTQPNLDMTNFDIRTRLARCFALTFPDLDQSEIERASTTTVATWNSLATITLVTLIEEAFDIRVRPAEIPRFNSYKAVLADIESRLGPS